LLWRHAVLLVAARLPVRRLARPAAIPGGLAAAAGVMERTAGAFGGAAVGAVRVRGSPLKL
jgi:hypothetical protein